MSKQKYKCKFQDIWLENEEYKSSLGKHPDDISLAKGKLCAKDKSVGGLGVKALRLRAQGSKHQERLPNWKQQTLSFAKSKEEAPPPKLKQNNNHIQYRQTNNNHIQYRQK